MAAVAQYYSDNLRTEVLKGMDEKVRQGWPTGLAPYGYLNVDDKDEPVQPHPEESRAIVRIFELYSTGKYTFDALEEKLAEEGFLYRPSQPRFNRSALSHILNNRFYAGELVRNGNVHPGKYRLLIDRQTFRVCQDFLTGKNRRMFHHTHLNPGLDEAELQKPPCLLMIDEYHIVYRRQRRVFVSGKPPEELRGCRIIDSRTWHRYQALKEREPPWEKALRCQARLAQERLSIRDLAHSLGIHHSGLARTLELLKLPDEVLQALRRHGADTRVRAHFTKKRLRAALAGPYPQDLLAEIKAVLQDASPEAVRDGMSIVS